MTRQRNNQLSNDVMRWLATGAASDLASLADAAGVSQEAARGAVNRLKDRGYITYQLKPNAGGGRPRFVNIQLTHEGHQNLPDPIAHAQTGSKAAHFLPSNKPGDMTDYRNHPTRTTGSEPVRTYEPRPTVTVTSVVTSLPQRSSWPELERIRQKQQTTDPLRIAANTLDPNDPLRAALEKRIEMEGDRLTTLEKEYLTYAAQNPGARR